MSDLNFSELLYLHADEFVKEAGKLQNKEELPNGKKLPMTKLGNILTEAAFAYLVQNNLIELKLEKKKMLGFIPQKVVTANRKTEKAELSSLEEQLFNSCENKDVHYILSDLIGEDMPVPWSKIINIVKSALVKKNYLIEEEISKKVLVKFTTYKYHLNESKKSDLSSEVHGLRNALDNLSKNDYYELLVKSINSGIRARIEQSDADFD